MAQYLWLPGVALTALMFVIYGVLWVWERMEVE
jgi:hypothetical protein